MKLFTDPGNFQTLKIFAAAELAGVTLEVTERKPDDKVVPYLSSASLPVLEVTPGKYLFSVTAAVRYLLRSKVLCSEDEITQDRWLEWDTAQLQPILVAYLVSSIGKNKTGVTLQDILGESKPAVTLQSKLYDLLKNLNTELKGKQTFIKEGVSSADVVIWGSLYPILKPGKAYLKDWESQYPNIRAWFSNLEELSAFQKAVSLVTPGHNTGLLKASLLAQPAQLMPAAVQMESADKPKKQQKQQKVEEKPEATETQSQVLSAKPVTPSELAEALQGWKNGKQKAPKPRKRVHPILPKKGERNIMITSALPYVNNVPHLGNIIGCVLSADVFSRYCRLVNYNVFYLCGTDEYGTATETKAIEEGLTPQQICDKYNRIHEDIYKWFNIDFDHFGRTTTKQQTEIAQDIFWKLHKNGFVCKDSVEQLQCVKCNRFLADRFVEGTCPLCNFDDARGDQCDACGKLINAVELKNPRCKICSAEPVKKSSDHLFLDLPKVEPELKKHLDKVFKEGTWTHNAQVITNSWIRDGLKPRCISRDLKWGTQVPLEGYTDKVFYVWFDAPIGYISITANYTDQWKQWWNNPDNVELYNFLGKDNVPFHSVIFPCTLLGADDNFTLVKHMIATEYLNYEDGKFSKSRETGVFGNNARDTGIPADIFRFYLLFVRPESQDSSFSWDDFLLKNNSELLNNLGNFINRALMFVNNSFGGLIQQIDLTQEDEHLLAQVNRELAAYIDNMEQARIRDSIRNILSISRLGNQFMQSNKPWVLAKGSEEERRRSGSVVSLAANISGLLSILLQPYMPATSQTIQTQLNFPADCNVITPRILCYLSQGHKIGQPSPLFDKITTCTIEELKKKFAGKPPPPKASGNKGGKPESAVDAELAAKLTEQVATQGNVVRELKTQKADKSKITPEVEKLLDLKKQLAAAQGQGTSSEGGKKKGKQPPVEEKKPTAASTGGASNDKEVNRLTEEVSKQGNLVRDLKSKKAEKSEIDAQVAALLDLKKQLALAQGQDPNAVAGGGKKKGKKK